RTFSSLVKLGHTIFGLPFALAAATLAHQAARASGSEGLTIARLLWILLAFTAARTAAMGFNRVVDRSIDAENPRTADRELPRGALSVRAASLLTALSAAAFLGAAWALGPLPGVLALPCLALVLVYSLFKRFSWSAHIVLGCALALAPGGAWIAVTGSFAGWPVPTLLMVAVATWVAGFDIIYSLQDEGFDRARGLHSIPVRFGARGALVLSALLHLGTVGALVALHALAGLGLVHGLGVALIGVILVYEHWIVRPGDLSRVDKAFFDLNGYVSIAYLACVLLDALL
ncbi:MAG: putative 4-hydroxybenzoate polyprenyltransferase, partial [Myxococcales bacterium]|nr:putative 4-hydroxybenzoate polyprenyltransferase [Myxococcales bacterium]